MPQTPIATRFTSPPGRAFVRALTGHDEWSVAGADTRAAIGLIDRLLVAHPQACVGPGDAGRLAAADRDRILAAVQAQAFGDRIETTLRCRACESPFDIRFLLSEMLRRIEAQQAPVERRADGAIRENAGPWLRLPTGDEECAVAALPTPEALCALATICLPDGDSGGEPLDEQLDRVAPVLSIDLDATCPECGAGAPVRFDVQSFLLASLVRERPRLVADIHRLAAGYGWRLDDILCLPREDRRRFVAHLEAERTRPRRSAA